MQEKKGAALLIKKFFGINNNQEIIALPAADRVQLGTAIAKQEGLKPEECGFEWVEY